jgi:hypothetical protein
MREHFISRLSLLLVSAYLVVATQVWPANLEWMFIVGGIVMIALAAYGATVQNGAQRALDGLVGLLGVWSIVEAIIFNGSALQWVSFVTALVGAGFAVIGLAIHEMTTERVVHELSVTSAAAPGDRHAAPLVS